LYWPIILAIFSRAKKIDILV